MSKFKLTDSRSLETFYKENLSKKGNSTDFPGQDKNLLINSNYNYNHKSNTTHNIDLFKAFDTISYLFVEKDKKIIHNKSRLNQLEYQNNKLIKDLNEAEAEKQYLKENNFYLVKRIEKLNKIIEEVNFSKDTLNKMDFNQANNNTNFRTEEPLVLDNTDEENNKKFNDLENQKTKGLRKTLIYLDNREECFIDSPKKSETNVSSITQSENIKFQEYRNTIKLMKEESYKHRQAKNLYVIPTPLNENYTPNNLITTDPENNNFVLVTEGNQEGKKHIDDRTSNIENFEKYFNYNSREFNQKSEDAKTNLQKIHIDQNNDCLSDLQKNESTNNIKRESYKSYRKYFSNENDYKYNNKNTSSSISPKRNIPLNKNNAHYEFQKKPIINHNRNFENSGISKEFKNGKPNQDEIKDFLLKVKEIITIKDFKKFIGYIKLLTVKDINIDKNVILEKVSFIFRNNKNYFENFKRLLLFVN